MPHGTPSEDDGELGQRYPKTALTGTRSSFTQATLTPVQRRAMPRPLQRERTEQDGLNCPPAAEATNREAKPSRPPRLGKTASQRGLAQEGGSAHSPARYPWCAACSCPPWLRLRYGPRSGVSGKTSSSDAREGRSQRKSRLPREPARSLAPPLHLAPERTRTWRRARRRY